MQKITCLIIDDEPLALDLVERYVLRTPVLELKGKCTNPLEGMNILRSEKIDLIFLDIQMPDMNGVDFSKTLKPETKIIFTTAFKEYAFEGFKVNAVDYLLKPFDYTEFLKATNKALERIGHSNEQVSPSKYIFVKSEYKIVKINLDEVFYFEGLKDYIKIWLSSQPKPILTLMSLKTIEEQLPGNKFMRIHRSFVIALDKISMVERGQVIIYNQRISIAEQYKDRFHQFIENKSFH